MAGFPLPSRAIHHHTKTVTFNGGTAGEIGDYSLVPTVVLASVTGRVLITHLFAYCSTTLASGGTATIEVGVSGNTAGLIAQIADATDLIATEFWNDATPTEVSAGAGIYDKAVASDIILTHDGADLTAGVIEFGMYWRPLSLDGNISG